MSGWQTVLDHQHDILSFWRSPLGGKSAATFAQSMIEVESDYGTDMLGSMLAAQLRGKQIETFQRANPMYVDPHMMDLVEVAAESFQPETFEPSDLITPHAFVVLPRPLTMLDRKKKVCTFRGIAWSEQFFSAVREKEGGGVERVPDSEWDRSGQTSGVLLSLYSDINDDDDDLLGMDELAGGREWREATARKNGTPWMLLHTTPWPYGAYTADGTEEQEGRLGFWKPVQAFLRLTLQTITDRHTEKPPRASRRRWQREFNMDDEKLITVIKLRRPRNPQPPSGNVVEWSHQWVVSGHWRNQFYPTLNLHRQIWIHPYLKGPEDAPLLVKQGRAFELVK